MKAIAYIEAIVRPIQWDEWPSIRRSGWEAVLRLLQNLQAQFPGDFVPKVIVCYEDFRQIPPVVPRGTRQTIVQNSVRFSSAWDKFVTFWL